MNQTHLTGLEGTNPLGFLAALGVQVAFASEGKQPRLWWSDDIIPHAVVDEEFGLCLLYTSPSPRDGLLSRMPSSA